MISEVEISGTVKTHHDIFILVRFLVISVLTGKALAVLPQVFLLLEGFCCRLEILDS
jgi:hypothetical protein